MTKPLTLQLAKSIAWKRNKDVRGELLLLSLFLYTFQNLPSSKIGRLGCTWRKYSRTMMSSVDLIGMCKQPLTSSVLASSGDMTDNSSNCRKLKYENIRWPSRPGLRPPPSDQLHIISFSKCCVIPNHHQLRPSKFVFGKGSLKDSLARLAFENVNVPLMEHIASPAWKSFPIVDSAVSL